MSEETGKDIGCKIRNYIETNKRAWQSDQAKFMRIQVELQINKPLRIGRDNKHCVASSDMQTKEHQYGDWIRANERYRGSNEKVKSKNDSSNRSNGIGEMTQSQTPTKGIRALAVEANEGTQKSGGSQGIGKAASWVAQDDLRESRKQATSQPPRWDNSEKFVQKSRGNGLHTQPAKSPIF
nr:hypothetical protein CFP56_77046 [Quercus suber]